MSYPKSPCGRVKLPKIRYLYLGSFFKFCALTCCTDTIDNSRSNAAYFLIILISLKTNLSSACDYTMSRSIQNRATRKEKPPGLLAEVNNPGLPREKQII